MLLLDLANCLILFKTGQSFSKQIVIHIFGVFIDFLDFLGLAAFF